ncbi:MAG: helix-hairpin-helix domain-containing protein [Ignavibacteria bacterium]
MNNLMKYISFTKNETKVILFIVVVITAGFSIRYYKHLINDETNTPYDYSGSDAEFKRLSGGINKNKSGANDSLSGSELDLMNELKKEEDSTDTGSKEKGSTGIYEKIININTATRNELIDLPGIGESTADKIISYRENKKGFRKTEEIMNVSGIGKKKYEKIKSYIKAE